MKFTPENVGRAWKEHLDTVPVEEFARNVFAALPADSEIQFADLNRPQDGKSARQAAKASRVRKPSVPVTRQSSRTP